MTLDLEKLRLTDEDIDYAIEHPKVAEPFERGIAEAALRKALWGILEQGHKQKVMLWHHLQAAIKEAGLAPWKEEGKDD